ncbi:MAG: metal-dependent transcriptional regulator [Phycisphaerae bacterium]|nr:metal-dependent transcriptional regulator [Phycisphaerae bacterium]
MSPKLSPSQEDYLEAVLDLVRAGQVARVRDIARRLGVGMPSVTVALRQLSSRGLVNYDPYQVVTLTAAGRQAGEEIERRHRVLESFLTDVLGLDEAVARANACRMEHAVDATVLERLSAWMERLGDEKQQPLATSHKPQGKARTGRKRQ